MEPPLEYKSSEPKRRLAFDDPVERTIFRLIWVAMVTVAIVACVLFIVWRNGPLADL